MPDSQALQQLLNQRGDLWRGRHRSAAAVASSGRAELNHWLPDGGWPHATLTELLPDTFGSGELDILLPLLAEQTRQGQPVLLVAPPLVPCPQRLHRAGLALDRLMVIRAQKDALWAAEQALKSGVCGSIVTWYPRGRVDARSIRRLQLAARAGDAPAFLCYRPGQQPPPSLSALRLGLAPGPRLTLLRGGSSERTLHMGRPNVIALASARDRYSKPA